MHIGSARGLGKLQAAQLPRPLRDVVRNLLELRDVEAVHVMDVRKEAA